MSTVNTSILSGFSEDQLKRFESLSVITRYEQGITIIKDGSRADCFYIVKNGSVEITKDSVLLALITPDMHIGVMALIDGSSRSASAITKESSLLIRVPYDKIKKNKNNDIYQKIVSNQLILQQQQLRRMNEFTVAKENEKLQHATQKELIEIRIKQNETLLKEIHHRVKNNLQTISSLLYLQSVSIKDKEIKNSLTSTRLRVESMALIHKMLYQRENLGAIGMKAYISTLFKSLHDVYNFNSSRVKLNIDMEEFEVDVDRAIPLGLIINELVTNAFKYAFPNKKKGEISIEMKKDKSGTTIINLSDNGIGNYNTTGNSFGTQLISLLTKQIEGEIESGNDNGHWIRISY